MRKYFLVGIVFFTVFFRLSGQPVIYTVANAHAHNDYVHPHPFFTAYEAGFGSIEADIFLFNNQLLIGHDSADLVANRTLEHYYLKPLDSCIKRHKGSVYSVAGKKLVLLIDIKTRAIETLDKLIQLLKNYPAITDCPTLKVVITGNRPSPALYVNYPSFIWFDGILSDHYETPALSRIVMMSDDLKKYTNWTAISPIPDADEKKLQAIIEKMHQLQKPVRFWNAPDTRAFWKQLIKLGADYINTDHIPELAAFLNDK